MKLNRLLISAAVLAASVSPAFAQGSKLTGSPMGSDVSQARNVFDGNLNTYFRGSYYADWNGNATYVRNWAGLDLGKKYVIKKVGIAPYVSKYAHLAVVQGANNADFSDALPIAMFKSAPAEGKVTYVDVNVSRGFRYVRVVATASAGYFAEVEFYGTQGEGDDSQFYQITDLPTVSFNTPGMAEIKSKEDKHPGSYVAVISDGGRTLLVDANAQMKGRGNGSWTFPKKPFQIKFEKKKQPLDAPAKAKKLTLINNYGDKTLMRNKVAYEMSREAGMPFTPYCTFVDVIYNGEYEGAYQLCDQVEVNSGRVELTEMLPTDTSGDALTGGYFIEIDAYANQEVSWFTSDKGIPVTIKSPKDDEIVAAQSQYIQRFFNRFEASVFASNFTDPVNGYRKYLDLDSFLKYFILCELNGNVDSFWSTYLWKERSEDIFHVGPIWDIDLGFQNTGSPYPVSSMNDFLYTHKDASKASASMEELVNRIVKEDAGAKKRMSEIWSDLRNNYNFSADYFNGLIDEYAETLSESQELNFMRWPILNKSVQKSQRIWYTYEAEVKNIKDYITDRFPKLDELIGYKQSSGIDGIFTDVEDADAPVELFNLQGQRVTSSDPAPGIYIRRCGGKTEKIVIR